MKILKFSSPSQKQMKLSKKIMMSALVLSLFGTPLTTSYATGFGGLLPNSTDQEAKNSKQDELTEEDLQKLVDVYNSIKFGYIKDIDKQKLLEGALKGMVSATGDPFSEYFNADETSSFDDSVNSSFEGIGVEIMAKDGQIMVVSPFDNSPADKAGLLPNDIIIKADGKEIKDMSTSEAVKLIRGKKGTEVKLTIQRGSNTFDVKLKRDTIPLVTVKAELSEKDKEIAIIRISQFAKNTYDELQKSIKDMRDKGAKRFVFDLRGNPGGLLDQAIKISNMFLKNGQVIMQVEERDTKADVYKANDAEYGKFQITEPYVVLVDDGSASASEILAAAISENTEAPLVGSKTFGKGTVQTIMNESDLGELKLTIAKWLTPKGLWIHESGIKPDITVEREPASNALMLNADEVIKKHQSDEYVSSLSLMLKALGYPVESEGYFDDQMEEMVKKFQKDNQLPEDGQVTGKTSELLVTKTSEYLDTHDAQLDKALEALKKIK